MSVCDDMVSQAVVLCQVERAKDAMLNQLYSSIRFLPVGPPCALCYFLPITAITQNYLLSFEYHAAYSSSDHPFTILVIDLMLKLWTHQWVNNIFCVALSSCQFCCCLFAPLECCCGILGFWGLQCPFYRKDWRTLAGGSRGEETSWAVSKASCSFEQADSAAQHAGSSCILRPPRIQQLW